MPQNDELWAIVAPYALGEIGKPVQILKTGKFYFDDLGELDITKDDLKAFYDNFRANVRGQKLPITREHMPQYGKLGDIADLELGDDGTTLYAVPDYNEFGQKEVNGGAWGYTSVEFRRQWTHPETRTDHRNVLMGLTLTNYPRIKGMEEVAASEPRAIRLAEPITSSEQRSTTVADNAETRLAELAKAQETMQAQLTQLAEQAKTAEAAKTELAEKLGTTEAKLSETTTKLADATTALAEAQRQIGVERETRLLLQFSEGLDKATREGRITPAQREAYQNKAGEMPQAQREWLLTDVAERPKVALLGEVGSGAPRSEQGGNMSATTERVDLAERAKTIMAEKKIGYKAALLQANKEMSGGTH
ncbi:MAG: hypothetical protein H0X24_23140 [Ktedonobacterales bacterium]|nr:hypothetical protein [Ktedonobacterales bacterium]